MARIELKQVRGLMSRNEWLITGAAVVLSIVAGLLTAIHAMLSSPLSSREPLSHCSQPWWAWGRSRWVRAWGQEPQESYSPPLATYLNSLLAISRCTMV